MKETKTVEKEVLEFFTVIFYFPVGFLPVNITPSSKPPQQKTQRIRQTNAIRDQNKGKNLDSNDSDSENENESHYAMVPTSCCPWHRGCDCRGRSILSMSGK
ncbi:hypothetical protein KIL84_014157 [Mauremys mutica]|uniref:Uncharacterized protein n=1 Tax=Mauremys mutica TaxID=74926 RepID=A0A9D4B7G0_9SAUR|nr:hypothetical protein KIL84_014157 [Mauremys mutica]